MRNPLLLLICNFILFMIAQKVDGRFLLMKLKSQSDNLRSSGRATGSLLLNPYVRLNFLNKIDIFHEYIICHTNAFITGNCICAGKSNKYSDGKTCDNYDNYANPWYNGVWCYADTEKCADAKAHPDAGVPGYGASRDACIGGTKSK